MSSNGSRTVLRKQQYDSVEQMMEDFDSLPDDIRKFLKECPYRITIARGADGELAMTAAQAYEQLPLLIKYNARLVYGPDHPQAQGM